jgi:hypothetical protein
MEERYQDASDFARDLRDCRNTLLGVASAPAHLADGARGQPPAPNATRRTDKLAATKTVPASAPVEQEAKGLALSKAFDSHEATLKLAVLTGVERETPKPPARPAAAAPAASVAAASPDTRRDPKRVVVARAPQRRAGPSYAYLWLVGGLAIAIALALVLLR